MISFRLIKQEYLAIKLGLKNNYIKDITIEYFDFANNSFIQINDFFSNLYYSFLMRLENYEELINELKRKI